VCPNLTWIWQTKPTALSQFFWQALRMVSHPMVYVRPRNADILNRNYDISLKELFSGCDIIVQALRST
jgi:hypothetical protein